MNQFLCIAVFVFAFAIAKQVNAENLKPQIKITRIYVDGLNQKYMKHVSFDIKKHNATYNNFPITWIFVRDLPPVTASISVYSTDANEENSKLLLRKDVPICSENRYRKLLPKPLVVPETLLLEDSCLKKGEYKFDDFGVFRFEVLIPNIHEISDYYTIIYKYITDDDNKDIVAEFTTIAEWGYLNTE